jgi:hypothetical protein
MPRATPECLRLCWTDPVTGAARSVPLEGALRLGSSRQNDVVLPIRSVEPFHAEILGNAEGGWEVVALGVRRLKVGETMAPRASLSSGTEFAVGPVAIRVRPAGASPRPVSSTGSRRAFAPPPPQAAPHAGWHALAGVALAAATAVAAWSALRGGAHDATSERTKAVAASAPAPGRARPRAKPPLKSALEAGSLVLAASADETRGEPSGAVTVLVRLAGASVPVRGFTVTSAGLVVTNLRLVASAESILVRSAGAASVPARLVASDAAHDLALLESALAAPSPVAPLDDDDAVRRIALSLGVRASDLRSFVASHR